jgi:ribosomal-protein-serine acetyltransferase
MFSLPIDSHLSLEIQQHTRAQEICNLANHHIDYLAPRLPWAHTQVTLDQEIEFITKNLEWYAHQKKLETFIIYDGKLVGCIGAHTVSISKQHCELWYRIAQDYAGQWIMTRAVTALVDHLHQDRGIVRFVIKADINNIWSWKVAEKCWFNREGIEQSGGKIWGKFIDFAVYAKIIKK